MIQETKTGSFTKLTSTDGYIHRKGSDVYCRSTVMLPSESVDMYEEVDSIPPYTKEEYDIKVDELVRKRYPAREEFALQRKMLNILRSPHSNQMDEDEVSRAAEEYVAYDAYVNECKAAAAAAIMESKELLSEAGE